MIHTIKVIKELPGAKIDEEFDLIYPFWLGHCLVQDEFIVNKLVKGEWVKVILEPKKEASLEKKFMDAWGFTSVDLQQEDWKAERVMETVQIAKEHVLKVYDKKTKGNNHLNYVDSVRDDLENSFDEMIPKPRPEKKVIKV